MGWRTPAYRRGMGICSPWRLVRQTRPSIQRWNGTRQPGMVCRQLRRQTPSGRNEKAERTGNSRYERQRLGMVFRQVYQRRQGVCRCTRRHLVQRTGFLPSYLPLLHLSGKQTLQQWIQTGQRHFIISSMPGPADPGRMFPVRGSRYLRAVG